MRSPEALAGDLVAGFRRELWLTPKPGLVDLEDSGSHPDLTLATMERSLGLLGVAFEALATSLRQGEPLAAQVAIGQATERRLLEGCGTNTHRGALFLGGLLLAARWRAAVAVHAPAASIAELRPAVAEVARELLGGRALPPSPGEAARRRFHVGGIVAEALAGLPSVFDAALPAFDRARARGGGGDVPVFAMLARLMTTVEDTTALHRCGEEGLAQVRRDGRELERLLEAGGDHVAYLRARNAAWRELRLTMGGVADLLGLALGLLVHEGRL
jgi:triphosphoribosyl-dephospho-CoA synthase